MSRGISPHWEWARGRAAGTGVFLVSALVAYGVVQYAGVPGAHSSEAQAPPAALEAPPDEPLDAEPAEVAEGAVEAENVRDEALSVFTGRVRPGGTVGSSLRAQGIEAALVHSIAAAMRPVFDFRHAQAGDLFTLVRDASGGLMSFDYQRGRETVYRLAPNGRGKLTAQVETVPLERRVVHVSGLIDTSLFHAITGQGEQALLVHSFADIFAWDLDFSTQVQPGDEFRAVFEKFYDAGGFVRYGKILAAQYRTAERSHIALYFEDVGGRGEYFTPEGNSVRRSFLRAPVNFSRISSRYSKSRLHPILKVRRPHEGIDYAAPTGTPVWAVADGAVIFSGWSGGFGRLVKLRHANGFVTFYGHLSRYAKDLRKGQRVRQGDVIGYVGSTGLATGPHLDYRVKVNGRFVDPLRLKIPDGKPVPVVARERFESVREVGLAALREAKPPIVLEASL